WIDTGAGEVGVVCEYSPEFVKSRGQSVFMGQANQRRKSGKQVTIRPNSSDDGVAAELVQILEVMTADGRIDDSEIQELSDWLETNDSPSPALTFLRTTIELILEDGKISAAEREALHKAIERVLPSDLREQSKAVRTAIKALERETKRAVESERKQAERDERERVAVQARLNFMVMGVAYDGRAQLIEQHLQVDQHVTAIREIGNPFDANAILIRIPEGILGYVPREDAAQLAPLFDQGYRQIAYCTKILQGRRFPIPVIQLVLHRPNSQTGQITPDPIQYVRRTQAASGSAKQSAATGCLTAAVCLAVVLLSFVLWILSAS
ncbi:MAG: HIRAN domain-containing protein, partial [Bryobacteraceae bacterium]